MRNRISAEKLRQLVNYNPKTGVFTWKVRCGQRGVIGRRVGNLHPNGYRSACIAGCTAREHQFAWLYVYGVWPLGELDHRNGKRDDNRIDNLRAATRSQNCVNKRASSKSGLKGVHQLPNGKWRARIWIDLGTFKTKKAAGSAYLTKAKELHGEFARAV